MSRVPSTLILLLAVAAAVAIAPATVSAKTVWLCKPGLATNPCEGNLDATVVDAAGKATVIEPAAPAADPPIDCFYVYPTVSKQKTVNANLTIDPEERAVALAQAARFSQVCRVFAPMYPQLTCRNCERVRGRRRPPALQLTSRGVAELHRQLQRRPRASSSSATPRGHVLIRLIAAESRPQPQRASPPCRGAADRRQRHRRRGQEVGGDFQNAPACRSTSQTGCVVAYSSFNEPPPPDSRFGRTAADRARGALRQPGGTRRGFGPAHLDLPERAPSLPTPRSPRRSSAPRRDPAPRRPRRGRSSPDSYSAALLVRRRRQRPADQLAQGRAEVPPVPGRHLGPAPRRRERGARATSWTWSTSRAPAT